MRTGLEISGWPSEAPISPCGRTAAQLKIPERTLRAHFSEQFDISPVSYHLHLRLNLVRRKLLLSSSYKGAVAQAATEFGFWHMGRFGQQYRSLFGESPSATLCREASFERWTGFECP